MKIVCVIPGLSSIGGLEGFARDVSREMSKVRKVITLDYKNNLSLFSKVLMRISPKKLSAKIFINHYSKVLKKQYPPFDKDCLFHFWQIEPSLLFLDKNYIITCHGNEILTKNVTSFRRGLYKNALKNALLIHANSNYTKEYLIKNYSLDPSKIKVISPFINFNKLSKIRKIKNKKIVIGTISRLVKRKNVSNVVKALDILKKDYKLDFEYYLAGDGPERKNILRELKEVKFKWKYFGNISEERKIKEFYPSLDIFVMPPLELENSVEGFGIVYIEANAYDIPVIASNTGGVADAVKDKTSGIFVEPTNPADIAKNINYLIKNKYKFTPKEWAKIFDKKIIIKRFEHMYKKSVKK